MDKIAFARLVSYIVSACGSDLNESTIAEIDRMISSGSQPVPNPRDVVLLVESLACGRKIEAIKTFRLLTGFGLKESKDAVETVMREPIAA